MGGRALRAFEFSLSLIDLLLEITALAFDIEEFLIIVVSKLFDEFESGIFLFELF